MRKVMLLGATSSIARELALRFARDGAELYLGGRDRNDLSRIAADINLRTGATVKSGGFEAADRLGHANFFKSAVAELGGIDVLALCFGNLGDQDAAHHPSQALTIIDENFSGAVSLLILAAELMEQQGRGSIIVLGSVAGERGRRTNYIYASAKSGLAVFTQGLRARLHGAGVSVMTVKLGLVDTRMTWGRPRRPLVISPQRAAAEIYSRWLRGAEVVFVPRIWRPIMAALRLAPEKIMKRVNLG